MKRIAALVFSGLFLTASAAAATPAGAWHVPETEGTTMVSTVSKKKPKPANGIRIKSIGSDFGTILANGRRQAIYRLDSENDGRSECYGACAAAWPPVLTRGAPRASGKARQKWFGVTRREGGARQATYAGSPLYYYVGDGPGEVLCNNVYEFGGTWLVVHPSGKAG